MNMLEKNSRLERDFRAFDLFFVPSSLIRVKLGAEREMGRKINNLWYIPATVLEFGRLYGYYKLLENYF